MLPLPHNWVLPVFGLPSTPHSSFDTVYWVPTMGLALC